MCLIVCTHVRVRVCVPVCGAEGQSVALVIVRKLPLRPQLEKLESFPVWFPILKELMGKYSNMKAGEL